MALSQSLSTGISGLQTHQKAMDNIGNNLANVNTVGFKKGVYQFSTLLEQTMRGGMTADGSTGRGSINPISLGLGTQTGSINKVFVQGPIETTNNPNDMAIDGNGFFVLKQGSGYAYTRAGSFYRGEDGTLMAGNGLFVQGTAAVKNADGSYSIPQDAKMQNIVIPIGTTGGHAQTSQVSFAGNLDSRQEISTGTRLFGGTSYPTISNLQQWMWKDFDGGDPTKPRSDVDISWNALEEKSFAITAATVAAYSAVFNGTNGTTAILPKNVNSYANGVVMNIPEAEAPVAGGPVTLANSSCFTHVLAVDKDITGAVIGTRIVSAEEWHAAAGVVPALKYFSMAEIEAINDAFAVGTAGTQVVPLIEEVKVVNGGNVQTSAAYGIETPDFLSCFATSNMEYIDDDGMYHRVANDYTYPQWFYEATGATMSFDAIAALPPACYATAADIADTMRVIWGNGLTSPETLGNMVRLPVKGETFPASLQTPLEHLRYLKGNVWVQPFSTITNGREIVVDFKKGESQLSATFIYNRPQGPDPFNGQVALDRERSYTLEHFLKFLGGDVDEPTVACQRITPAMFGAPVNAQYPEGNYAAAGWNRPGYEDALKNVQLATNDVNWDTIGGAMGLLSIPPHISDLNYGNSAYDAPPESAGAYSREGVQTVKYRVWDPLADEGRGAFREVTGKSWNTSFVSNLGAQNALEDIKVTYNNVPHDAMYSGETEYAAEQGGSSLVTVDFYDSLGNPKTANVRMALVAQDDDFTTWRWYADCADDTDFPWQADPNTYELNSNLNVGTGLIRFDKNGNYVKGSEYTESNGININQSKSGVNEPIWIKMLNGLSGSAKQDLDFSELTCTAAANDFKMEGQNGRAPGTLDSFTVSLDGTISGLYSNSYVVPLGRIGLAIIPNENGLVAAGNNLFYTGPASGYARYGHANTGGNGMIRHMQLEASNVELSEEFTKMISTQRGFQANSRTITTADEMIQELMNLKR